MNGVKEYTFVSEGDNKLSTAKSVNYVENALMANESKKRGGYLGIKIDKDHNFVEAAIANIGFVLKNQTFVLPTFEKCIAGTTIKRVLIYLQDELVYINFEKYFIKLLSI